MRIIFLVALCGLPACSTSPTLRTASTEYVETRRGLHADFTDGSIAWLCRGISMHEWQLRFSTPEDRAAWSQLCSNHPSGLTAP